MIKFIISKWKTLGFAVLLIGTFYFGYIFNDYKRDSELSVAMEAAKRIMESEKEREQGIASIVEDKLNQLKANERVIERERIKVIEKPVYNVQCIDEEGLNIIKQYALGLSNE